MKRKQITVGIKKAKALTLKKKSKTPVKVAEIQPEPIATPPVLPKTSTMDQFPTTIQLKNKAEDIEDMESKHSFFLGLKAIQDKFYREVRAYGDQFKIEINTTVQFELIKH